MEKKIENENYTHFPVSKYARVLVNTPHRDQLHGQNWHGHDVECTREPWHTIVTVCSSVLDNRVLGVNYTALCVGTLVPIYCSYLAPADFAATWW